MFCFSNPIYYIYFCTFIMKIHTYPRRRACLVSSSDDVTFILCVFVWVGEPSYYTDSR